MALTDILGSLMANGVGGRTDTGPNFLDTLHQSSNNQQTNESTGIMGSGIGYGEAASLAGLAAIGYKAYTMHQQKEQERSAFAAQQATQANQSSQAPGGFEGVAEKVGSWFGYGNHEQHMPNLSKTMLLIETIIAAAAADGQITWDERNTIMQQVQAANPTNEERNTIEQLLNNPPLIDTILSQVRDQDTAEQVYYSACLGMQQNSPTAAPFLGYVAQKLGITPERRNTIEQVLYNSFR